MFVLTYFTSQSYSSSKSEYFWSPEFDSQSVASFRDQYLWIRKTVIFSICQHTYVVLDKGVALSDHTFFGHSVLLSPAGMPDTL